MDDFSKVFSDFEGCALTFFEKQLVSEIYPVIKRIIETFSKTRHEWPRYGTVRVDKRTILSYREKIDKIVKILDESDHKRENFLKNFPKWKIQRNKNIDKLRAIAEKMKDVRTVSNVVKIAAGGIGVVGGAAIIGSILFPPAAPALLPGWLGGAAVSALLPSVFLPAAPAVSSLAVAGGVAAAGGAVGNVGASITEVVLTHKSLDEAKVIIAEDRKLLEQLGVFEFFDDLNNAIDDLFGTSISSKIFGDLVDFLNEVPPIFDKIQPIHKALRICLNHILPGISKFLLIGISLASVILSIFFVVFLIRRRGCVILNHRLALGLVSAVDATVEITRLLAAAGLNGSKLGELIPRAMAGKIAVGAIAGAGIALDIASIVISSIDLAKGSLSEEISMIHEVANKLEIHLQSYQSVNYKLQNCVSKRLKIQDVTNWTAVVVNHVPRFATRCQIKVEFQQYLPDEAMDCVILEKLPTDGNHWLVKVPICHSHLLLRQSYISIVGESCLVMQ